ncbi:hypothetical protein FRC17_002320, partial [Serendipita sp. 399]
MLSCEYELELYGDLSLDIDGRENERNCRGVAVGGPDEAVVLVSVLVGKEDMFEAAESDPAIERPVKEKLERLEWALAGGAIARGEGGGGEARRDEEDGP